MHLEIVTPRGSALDEGPVEAVVLPGAMGEFGVLEGHIPFLGALKPGLLHYRRGGEAQLLAIRSGFAEVGADNRITVLTDACEAPGKLDRRAAEEDLAKAEASLREWSGSVEGEAIGGSCWVELSEYQRLQEARDWAHARLELGR